MERIEQLLEQVTGNLKLIERALLGLEGSYVEMLTVLALGLLGIVPVLVSRRRRQAARHAAQAMGLVIFILLVFTCLGVFGIIRNSFRGLAEIGYENIIALYYLSVPVVIMVTAMIFGGFFCGWICPTGTLQEFVGLAARRYPGAGRRSESGFSRPAFAAALALAAIFLAWVGWLSGRRVFFIDDAAVYWALVLVAILLLSARNFRWWDRRLRRLRLVSFFIILAGAIARARITSPMHFGFCKVYDPSSILATFIVLGGALVIPRLWCRYLCPWREAVAWAGRQAVRQLTLDPGKCRHCGRCERLCPLEAIRDGQVNRRECHLCLRCVDACPTGALRLEERWEAKP